MTIVLISRDEHIKNLITDSIRSRCELIDYSYSPRLDDVLSLLSIANAGIVFLDDDFLKPNSVQILKSIRSLLPEVKCIFLTSDSGIELGREISPLGIFFYAVKPVPEIELAQLLELVNEDTSIN